MRLINRSGFIIRPKEPFIEWASGTDDEAPATAHRMRGRVAVYLVPEDPTGREETPPLKDYYKEIFECELEAWYLDEDTWPEPRTLEMFLDWFDVSGQSVITDLGKGAVEAEEFQGPTSGNNGQLGVDAESQSDRWKDIMKKFAAGIPRKMFWSDDVGSTQVCPECGDKLERERHTYAMALREGSTVESLIVGNDAGYFCSQCPLVVLDRDVMEQYGMAVADHPDRMEFMVMGIVDLGAVPQEKANVALGGENNPVPFTTFTNTSSGQFLQPIPHNVKRKAGRRLSKKRRK